MKFLIEEIIEVAKSDPYYDHHPFFTPLEMKDVSLTKNLKNLIVLSYKEENINKMVKDKALFEVPIIDPTSSEYLDWMGKFSGFFMNRVVME